MLVLPAPAVRGDQFVAAPGYPAVLQGGDARVQMQLGAATSRLRSAASGRGVSQAARILWHLRLTQQGLAEGSLRAVGGAGRAAAHVVEPAADVARHCRDVAVPPALSPPPGFSELDRLGVRHVERVAAAGRVPAVHLVRVIRAQVRLHQEEQVHRATDLGLHGRPDPLGRLQRLLDEAVAGVQRGHRLGAELVQVHDVPQPALERVPVELAASQKGVSGHVGPPDAPSHMSQATLLPVVHQAEGLHLKTVPRLHVERYTILSKKILDFMHLSIGVSLAASDHLHVVNIHSGNALAGLDGRSRLHLPHHLLGPVGQRPLDAVGHGLVGEVERPRPAHANRAHAGVEPLAVHDLGLGPLGVVPDRIRQAAHLRQLGGVELVRKAEPARQLGDGEVVKTVPDVSLAASWAEGPGAEAPEA